MNHVSFEMLNIDDVFTGHEILQQKKEEFDYFQNGELGVIIKEVKYLTIGEILLNKHTSIKLMVTCLIILFLVDIK